VLEELAIKLYEKESLIKSFSLFFIIIELFLLFIFYNYYKIEAEHLREELFLEMKNYSFFLDSKKFNIDIVPKREDEQFYELYFDNQNIFILSPIPDDKQNALEIIYPLSKYKEELQYIKQTLLKQFLLLSIVAIIISFLFAIYTLHPLQKAFFMLEEFIKDIIHDLNTPITSILINLKMMKKNEEVENITKSANTIAMLHKNLIAYLKDEKFQIEKINLKDVVYEQVNFFKSIYYYIDWKVDIEDRIIYSNRGALSRIIYNLLSNACKYNRTNGYIKIYTKDKNLIIENSTYGVKRPSKIFKRFYKESSRGLGMGLHIVKKLSKELKISIDVDINEKIFKITLKIE